MNVEVNMRCTGYVESLMTIISDGVRDLPKGPIMLIIILDATHCSLQRKIHNIPKTRFEFSFPLIVYAWIPQILTCEHPPILLVRN